MLHGMAMADRHLLDGKGEINNQPDETARQQNDTHLLIRYSLVAVQCKTTTLSSEMILSL